MVGLHATFHYGEDVRTIPYTPSTAKEAGEIVVINQILGICHRSLAANEFGGLAIGGGVYTMIGDAAIAIGKPVYWDAAEGKATETSTGNKYLGIAVTACAADDGEFDVARSFSGDVAPGSGG